MLTWRNKDRWENDKVDGSNKEILRHFAIFFFLAHLYLMEIVENYNYERKR